MLQNVDNLSNIVFLCDVNLWHASKKWNSSPTTSWSQLLQNLSYLGAMGQVYLPVYEIMNWSGITVVHIVDPTMNRQKKYGIKPQFTLGCIIALFTTDT